MAQMGFRRDIETVQFQVKFYHYIMCLPLTEDQADGLYIILGHRSPNGQLWILLTYMDQTRLLEMLPVGIPPKNTTQTPAPCQAVSITVFSTMWSVRNFDP